ncbi:MAG: GerMN domain-containing protein [Candidatus Eisenbacteria bacterium]|nr:GerMN domain-containing protein [Candidatus Eisenbacteria bacterium]
MEKEGRSQGTPLWPWVLVVLVVFGVGGWLVFGRGGPRRIETETPIFPVDEEGILSRTAVLSFASADGSRPVTERREVLLESAEREAIVRRLVEELARGPLAPNARPVLPSETRVRGVYFDDLGGLYVDLDGASLADWAWGCSSELLAIGGLVRTLGDSFPEVLRLTLLVDGERAATLKGHVELSHPFEVAAWR